MAYVRRPRLLVLSGSGISAESGLRTYRHGVDALWEGHDPGRVCDMATLERNRDEVFDFYARLREGLRHVEPNAAHRAMADWQRRWGAVLATQNVDDLLERAGCEGVIHAHGSLHEGTCLDCGAVWPLSPRAMRPEDPCPRCGGARTKPGVSFFGEEAPMQGVMMSHILDLRRGDVAVVIGTSCSVIPLHEILRGSPARLAFCSLDPVGEMGEEALEGFDLVLAMPASRAVAAIQGFVSANL